MKLLTTKRRITPIKDTSVLFVKILRLDLCSDGTNFRKWSTGNDNPNSDRFEESYHTSRRVPVSEGKEGKGKNVSREVGKTGKNKEFI